MICPARCRAAGSIERPRGYLQVSRRIPDAILSPSGGRIRRVDQPAQKSAKNTCRDTAAGLDRRIVKVPPVTAHVAVVEY
jgi:hypothetical protein